MSDMANTGRKYSEQELIRMGKIKDLEALGIDPFGGRFDVKDYSETLKTKYAEVEKEELAALNIEATVAGRIMTKRGKGKAGFMHIQDNDAQIQIYLRQDQLSELEFTLFDKCDIGDIVGISGVVFKTNTGEVSVKANSYTHLTKALKPLPEKFHGISDDEIKFRKRYLDIITNRDVKELFLKKQKFWGSIRNFLMEHNFLEVETPVLETSSGGAAATPFATHHNALDIDVFLRISMGELWQKKLLVAGFEKTFEIGRQFRNEGMSNEHLQDYTQMEFYWAYADFEEGMAFCKDMYREITKSVMGSSKFTTRGFEIDMDNEWEIYDFETLIEEKTGINIFSNTKEEILVTLKKLNVEHDPSLGFWRLVDVLWKVVRKDLSGPGFLVGQPVQLNPLPRRLKGDARKVAQMQIILAGSEMGNGYTELNNPLDLEERFKEQREMGEAGDEEAHEHDETFIEALRYGMPPAFGFGVSERLFSVMMDKPIRDCVFFPLMKPKA
ncbi:lysine--tRNA ligase [Poseidonibacter sp.]|uniref:lysine--tRNA ligase n=1 Tax=Poseidonibacter sp. TaxID=2321188 RepID=UPI003C76178C